MAVKELRVLIRNKRDTTPLVLGKYTQEAQRSNIKPVYSQLFILMHKQSRRSGGAAKNKEAHRRTGDFTKGGTESLFIQAVQEVQEDGVWAKAVALARRQRF